MKKEIEEYELFKSKYLEILDTSANYTDMPETLLKDAYALGQDAINKKMDLISLMAIHQHCLMQLLGNKDEDAIRLMAEKSYILLEKLLMPYETPDTFITKAAPLLHKIVVDLLLSNRALLNSLQVKDVLVNEINHRVKNNLQIIASLLNLQVEETKDIAAKLALRESANRINAIALIHKILNRTDVTDKVEMQDYVKDIFDYLYDIYKIDKNKINHIIDVDNILLNIERAVPCGLIVNELISNIYKHAFPENKSGSIKIALKQNADNNISLHVSDNGTGIPASVDIENTTTLGIQLIQTLTRQLNGKLVLNRNNGTDFLITFSSAPK